MKNILANKKIMIALAIVLIAVAAFFIIRKRRNDKEEYLADTQETNPDESDIDEDFVAEFPLTPYSEAGEYSTGKGSRGAQIAKLQKICNAKGEDLKVDYDFGPKSEAAFRKIFKGYDMPYDEQEYNEIVEKYGG